MARRGLSSAELKKKRDEKFKNLVNKRENVTFENNRRNNSNNSSSTNNVSSKTKQGKKRTPAQIAAAKRLAQKSSSGR